MKRTFLLLGLIWVCGMLAAQVTTNPSPIPVGYEEKITLTFDPAKGNGGMAKATECYSHIGLITNKSTSSTDWKYLKPGGWGTTAEPKWTKVGDNWQLEIDNLFDYFGCPRTETIKSIVMVFHNGKGGTTSIMEGKTAAGGDIIITLGQERPADIWDGFVPAPVVTKARPSGTRNGITYSADGKTATLCMYAAGCKNANDNTVLEPAQHVFLIGDMTDWLLSNDYQLYRDGNYFWIRLNGLTPGQEYRFQYAVIRADGVKKQLSDLYSEKLLHPDDKYEPRTLDPSLTDYPEYGADGGYVSVLQPGKAKYEWSDATKNFVRPDKNNLVIYELWVYDHTPERSIRALMGRLDYLKNLGVNCVELMPVTEFDGNENWGYSPNHYFALDKAYGRPEELKQLIDACHQRGMAVVLDMVFNHATGLNPLNKLYPYGNDLKYNPCFNVDELVPHPDNVYQDWNHDFEPVHDMFKRVVQYWLTEYKVDGYRFDLSHGLCGKKYNAVDNIKDYYAAMQAASAGSYLILEHWGSSMATDCPKLINEGMLCWGNTSNAFCQVAMGWMKDGDALTSANRDGYVTYCESHDEERSFCKAKLFGDGDLKTNENSRVNRIPLVVGFQTMLNGPQMFYHFAELGFDYSKWQDKDEKWGVNDDKKVPYSGITTTYSYSVKMQPKVRPDDKGWFLAGPRMQGYKRLAQIIQLRTRLLPEVFAGNPTNVVISSGKVVRSITWGTDVHVVANFSATAEQTVTLPAGTWYDYLDGGEKATASYTLQPGTIKVFTGTQIEAPKNIPDAYDFASGLEDVMEATRTSNNAVKVIHEGRMYILRDGKQFDVMGRRY